jgi:hypothetical protein
MPSALLPKDGPSLETWGSGGAVSQFGGNGNDFGSDESLTEWREEPDVGTPDYQRH